MYQAVPEPPDARAETATKVLVVIDVPGGTAGTDHVVALADDFTRKVSLLVPGVRPQPPMVLHHDAVTGLTIDLPNRRVSVDGRPVRLAYREFALFAHLVTRPHRTVSRSTLLHSVWADRHGRDPISDRTVDVHVRRLRAKLGRYAHVLTTVRGHGYRFDPGTDVRLRAGIVRELAN